MFDLNNQDLQSLRKDWWNPWCTLPEELGMACTHQIFFFSLENKKSMLSSTLSLPTLNLKGIMWPISVQFNMCVAVTSIPFLASKVLSRILHALAVYLLFLFLWLQLLDTVQSHEVSQGDNFGNILRDIETLIIRHSCLWFSLQLILFTRIDTNYHT